MMQFPQFQHPEYGEPVDYSAIGSNLAKGLQSGIEQYAAYKKEQKKNKAISDVLEKSKSFEELRKNLKGQPADVVQSVLDIEKGLSSIEYNKARAAAAPVKAERDLAREARLQQEADTKKQRLRANEAAFLNKQLKEDRLDLSDEERMIIRDQFGDIAKQEKDLNKAYAKARKIAKTDAKEMQLLDELRDLQPESSIFDAVSSEKARDKQVKALRKEFEPLSKRQDVAQLKQTLVNNGFTDIEASRILGIPIPADEEIINKYLDKTGNDPERAKELLKRDGYII